MVVKTVLEETKSKVSDHDKVNLKTIHWFLACILSKGIEFIATLYLKRPFLIKDYIFKTGKEKVLQNIMNYYQRQTLHLSVERKYITNHLNKGDNIPASSILRIVFAIIN